LQAGSPERQLRTLTSLGGPSGRPASEDLNLQRFLRLVALVLALLVPSSAGASAQAAPPTPPPAASVYTSDAHPECTIVPVPSVDGVFTVDIIYVLGVQQPGTNSTGGPKCGPEVWTPAILFLRGLGNAGEGLSLRDVYLQGISVPKYVLVAAEACGDDRGFNCGFFSVLVPGQRSGEHWNAATAAAHNLQKSKPPTNLGPRASSGTWDFMGEEPQPVSDACLKALPLDPCWGSGYEDYSQPITPLAPSAVSTPTPSTQNEPPPPNIPPEFCGTWGNHGEGLTIDCTMPDYGATVASNIDILGRARVWCVEPGTNKRNPPPCDTILANGDVTVGIHISMWAEPSTDPAVDGLIATVVLSNTEFTKRGESEQFTMEPGNLLHGTGANGYDAYYCNDTTDPAVRSLWCGA
jgi:hypothetical protein